MSKKANLKGKIFGRLFVLEEAGRYADRSIVWKCQCNCVNNTIINVPAYKLRNGHTKSCGCISRERTTKHGLINSQSYNVWTNMISRCYNPKNPKYSYYGGRGIKVCERWWKFENFYEDIGKYRTRETFLDRKDNNDDYRPGNCRWVVWQKQMQNRRAKGYHWIEQLKKWRAIIQVNGKKIHLGLFDEEEDARKAYQNAKERLIK